MTKPSLLRSIGVITGAHALQGEVTVKPWDDDPQWAGRLPSVFLFKNKGPVEMAVLSSRKHGNSVIFRFKEVTDRTEAEQLKGVEIKAFDTQLPPLEADEFYTEQLVGLAVVSRDSGETLGLVQDVLSSDAGDFLEVTREGLAEPVLVPFQTVFVPTVDKAQATVFVTGLDSLFLEG